MKVVFWSNYANSAVTTNLTVLSASVSLMYPGKLTLLSNHFASRSLGYMLLGKTYDNLLRDSIKYENYGDNRFYLRKLLSHNNFTILNGGSYDGLENGLYYYIQEHQYSSLIHEINQYNFFNDLVGRLEKVSDYVFIDLQSQGSLNTLQLLEIADLVVVNLRQDETIIRNFFKRYGSLVGKCFFVIGNYRENGKYLKRNFIRDYRIHPERVAVIPHIRELDCAFDDGRILPYICSNFNCGKKSRQYKNMWYVKYAAGLLIKNISNISRFCGEDELNA